MDIRRIKLWDLPTRVAHWALVILILAQVISGKIGGNAIEWHGRIGLVILGVIVFRIVWGFIGSSHSRFASFFPTPASLRAHLRGQWQGVGHNPLGAFSVFAMFGMIAVQLATGLFANDDIAFNGPLFKLVSKELSDRLTGIHLFSINILIALIVLHILAIAYYALVNKDNLVTPMITGWKELKTGSGESGSGGGTVALVVALLIAFAAVYAATGAWLAVPPAASAPVKAGW